MRIIDISREISGRTAVYPGDDPVVLERPWKIGPDCPVNMSRLSCTTHTATHLDAPLHMLETGAALDSLPLERFILPARVIDVAGRRIGPEAIPPREEAAGKALLFRTRPSGAEAEGGSDGQGGFIDPDAARLAVERGVALAGVESLSVDPLGGGVFAAHRALLEAGVLILEGLDLRAAPPGDYMLIALPLKIRHADGAPVRAVLVEGWTGQSGPKSTEPPSGLDGLSGQGISL